MCLQKSHDREPTVSGQTDIQLPDIQLLDTQLADICQFGQAVISLEMRCCKSAIDFHLSPFVLSHLCDFCLLGLCAELEQFRGWAVGKNS